MSAFLAIANTWLLELTGLLIAGFGILGRFWFKHESAELDRRFGADPK